MAISFLNHSFTRKCAPSNVWCHSSAVPPLFWRNQKSSMSSPRFLRETSPKPPLSPGSQLFAVYGILPRFVSDTWGGSSQFRLQQECSLDTPLPPWDIAIFLPFTDNTFWGLPPWGCNYFSYLWQEHFWDSPPTSGVQPFFCIGRG